MVRIETPAAKSARIPALASISTRLEAAMDAVRPFGDTQDPRDLKLALASLLLSCHVALDSLAAIGGRATLADMAAAAGLFPISGGAPVVACDCEDCKPYDGDCDHNAPDVESDPSEWPAEWDNWFWTPTPDALESEPAEAAADYDGPTPVEVLAADSAAPAFEPSAADWEYLFSAGRDGLITEHDLAAAGLAVG